jgi:sugar (pentulose or hexulose) kinase
MPAKDHILAIDNGTQSLKAMLFDLSGNLRAIEKIPFTPYVSPHPGWAEQDPELYWNTLCKACQGLWQKSGNVKDAVAGMALTTQRGTVVNVDAKGTPLRPAILWLDQRKTFGLPPVSGLWGALFTIAGLSKTVAYFQREAEANWIMTHQPEIWKKTHKFLLLSGFLTHRLTGKFIDSVGCQVGYLPFDYKRQDWARASDWKWQGIPVKPEMLPELSPPGALLGHVTSQAARMTGIPEGLPVIAAAADKACEVIGAGTLEPSTGCISYGTTATINVTHPKYLEPIRLIPAYPSAVPGRYCLEVQIFRGYWMVSWFRSEFGREEAEKAKNLGVDAEALFDRLIEDTQPGGMGLILQPYWSPGIIQPGPEAKGAVIGFGDIHTRAHLYRAILEGLAYALREGSERIQKRTRTPIRALRVSGGGSQSRQAMQVTADIFNIPASRPHLYETSGLGAAITAAAGLGLMPDFAAAVRAMTRTGDVFEPDPRSHKLYDALYQRVYKRLYSRVKPLYREIRRITGYPR